MKFSVIIQSGVKYIETIDYAIVIKQDGQFAILDKHIPVLTTIDQGYIKIVQGNLEDYIFVKNGALVFQNHELKCFALQAEIGKTMEDAKQLYERSVKSLREQTKKENVDYSKLEHDLQAHIIKSGAGHI